MNRTPPRARAGTAPTRLTHLRGNPNNAPAARWNIGITRDGLTDWPAVPAYRTRTDTLWSRQWACLDWAVANDACHVSSVGILSWLCWLRTGRTWNSSTRPGRDQLSDVIPRWLDSISAWGTPEGRLVVAQPYRILDETMIEELAAAAARFQLSIRVGSHGWRGAGHLLIEMRPAGFPEGVTVVGD